MQYLADQLKQAKAKGEPLPASFLEQARQFLKDNEISVAGVGDVEPESVLDGIDSFTDGDESHLGR